MIDGESRRPRDVIDDHLARRRVTVHGGALDLRPLLAPAAPVHVAETQKPKTPGSCGVTWGHVHQALAAIAVGVAATRTT